MKIYKIYFLVHQNLKLRHGYAFDRAEMQKRLSETLSMTLEHATSGYMELEIPQRISKTKSLFSNVKQKFPECRML